MLGSAIPFLEIFLGILGFGLSIMFCTTFCRACSRLREAQIEMEAWRRNEHDSRPRSIYVIPFPRSLSQQDIEDQRGGELGDEFLTPPRYSTSVYYEPPPSYNELEFKPDDLPPTYTEQNFPMYPLAPPPPHPPDMVQSQAQSQP